MADQCSAGRQWSELLQMCANRDDYNAAMDAAVNRGNLDLARRLAEEAVANGAIKLAPSKNALNALLLGDWGFFVRGLLPIIVGVIGLVLVFLAVSSWLKMDSITIAGVGVPLPNPLKGK
jgi:hypothetical protein